MKIYTSFEALVLATISTQSKDGQNTYYKASLMDLISKEAGSISCSKEVADMIKPMMEYKCTAVFDNTYNPPSFRITMVTQINGKSLEGAPTNSGSASPAPGNARK